MFGYVKPYRPSLVAYDYEFYRATYCGVCRAMKRETGTLSTWSLNFDFVFLALVRLLIGENRVSLHLRRCGAHPFRRRLMLMNNPATDYAARVSAVLVYHKLKDDLHDSRLFGKLPPALALPVFAKARRRANLGELDKAIADYLQELSKVEAERVASIDIPAGIFGKLLGDIFAYDAKEEYAPALRSLGCTLGTFIYAADAADDFEADVKSGSYNPYVLTYGDVLTEDARRAIYDGLILTLSKGEADWHNLPMAHTTTVRRLIENIMYEGLLRRIEFLKTGKKKSKSKPKSYDGALP